MNLLKISQELEKKGSVGNGLINLIKKITKLSTKMIDEYSDNQDIYFLLKSEGKNKDYFIGINISLKYLKVDLYCDFIDKGKRVTWPNHKIHSLNEISDIIEDFEG